MLSEGTENMWNEKCKMKTEKGGQQKDNIVS